VKYLLTLFFILSALLSLHTQTLNEYLNVAGENNPSLKASYAEFEASMKRVTQVNALPDPSLSFGYFIRPIETREGPQRAKVSLTQLFPWFGTLKAKATAATLQGEAKYQAFLDKKNQLFFQVKQAYYPLFEVNEHIHLQQHNLKILESYKQLMTTSFANGKGTMIDVLRVGIIMEDVMTDIRLLKDRLTPLTVSFNRLLNRPDTSKVFVNGILKIEALSNEYLKDSIITQSPKIKQMGLTL